MELSFVEKAAVDYLFGGLPTGDLKASIKAFQKCISLSPNMMIYRYDYAIALEANDQEKEAIAVMKQILGMKQTTQDDAGIQADAKRMIAKWS
jgi:predicted Zn-dependent protease